MTEPATAELQVSAIERATHYATLCRCHRDLWGPLCAPYLHGTVPIVLDEDAAKRIVTCRLCRGDMEKRGMLDA